MPAQLVLITNAWIPGTVLQDCRDICATCADLLGEPVHFWRVRSGEAFGAALGALREASSNALETIQPRGVPSDPMSSAPFVWRKDGRPDWRAMWSDFCELALFGGPPQRGPESVLHAVEDHAATFSDLDPIAETRRGIWETTGLESSLARPGWLSVSCDSPRMAAWLCATITLENVDALCDGATLLVPAGETFAIEDHVKSVITVVAKTHHYWTEHVRRR